MQEALGNYQQAQEKLRGVDKIAKSKCLSPISPQDREQLAGEIAELTTTNRRLQEAIDHTTSESKQQTEKYKESEKVMRDEIAALEAQVRSTQTEQFTKLREDNKQLIQDSMGLRRENDMLREKNRTLAQTVGSISHEEESIKDSLMKELNEVQGAKIRLDTELKRAEVEKYWLMRGENGRVELEALRKQLIKQTLKEEKKGRDNLLGPEGRSKNFDSSEKIMEVLSMLESPASRGRDENLLASQTAESAASAKKRHVKSTREIGKREEDEEDSSEEVIAGVKNIKATLERYRKRRSRANPAGKPPVVIIP